MFTRSQPTRLEEELDEQIAVALSKLTDMDPTHPEYTLSLDNIKVLYQFRESNKTASNRVSPDTLAVVIGNLVGIVLIVGYEQKNVITSKALNFVLKATR